MCIPSAHRMPALAGFGRRVNRLFLLAGPAGIALMSDTINAMRGSRPITTRRPAGRLVWFLLAVILGALGIVWIDANVWQRMTQLERDFGAVKTERFYQSVHVRLALRNLNDLLLEFQLKDENKGSLTQFRHGAEELQRWLVARQQETTDPDELALLRQMEATFATYLSESKVLHERRGFLASFTTTSTRMAEAGEHLDRISAPLLDHAERLMRHQRTAFTTFLGQSQQTLDSFQRLIKLSLQLLVLLALLVVILVYRGMIAPLRLQLSESQAIIARQEKLAALGGLAAGVAHEIRNPLTAIKFRLFSLKKALPPTFADNEDASIIADEISRLERIVREFLEFARPSEPETAKVSAQRLLDEVSRLIQAQLEQANIKLEVPSANGLWLAIDFQQIKQVLINLIRNAAESIEGPGTVTLRATGGDARLGGTTRSVAIIEVADTGRGIPPEVGERLFDPFFTTKEGGTGLGLSIAARIVEKHGGELRYETQLDRGTTFRLLLPAIPENESENPAH